MGDHVKKCATCRVTFIFTVYPIFYIAFKVIGEAGFTNIFDEKLAFFLAFVVKQKKKFGLTKKKRRSTMMVKYL